MEFEYQTRAKIRELQRETAHIRLVAAAERASSQGRRAAPDRRRETSAPRRLPRVLRPAA